MTYLTFDDAEYRSWPYRALQIWQILIAHASNKQLLTFGELAKIIGFDGAGVLAHPLGYIMDYCQYYELPPLTSIVINQVTGSFGDGLVTVNEYETVDLARLDVFYFQWYKLLPPSIEELENIHSKIWKK